MAEFIRIDQADIDPDMVVGLTQQRDSRGRVCTRILLRGGHAVLVEPSTANEAKVQQIRDHKVGGRTQDQSLP